MNKRLALPVAALLLSILLRSAAAAQSSDNSAQSSDNSTQSSADAKKSKQKDEASGEPDLINADRPGIADGSTVVGAKHAQIETGLQAEFRRDGDVREHTQFFPTLLRVGITDRFEARVEGNSLTHTSEIEPGAPTRNSTGLAPFSFGFKYHFTDSKGASHPSLGTIVRVFPAWGTGDFRAHHVAADARLAADWDFAPHLSLNPNVGISRYEDDQNRTFVAGLFAVTLNYLPTKKLNPFVDMGLQAPEEKAGRSSVILDTGIAYIVGHNVQLDASFGSGAHGRTPPHPFVSFGVSLRSRHKQGGE